jgi:hypothetical protein
MRVGGREGPEEEHLGGCYTTSGRRVWSKTVAVQREEGRKDALEEESAGSSDKRDVGIPSWVTEREMVLLTPGVAEEQGFGTASLKLNHGCLACKLGS